MKSDLALLPAEVLLKTGDVDHADWNHKPLIGTIQRMRYRLVQELIGNSQFERLLEIEYGSGVFLPELAKRTKHLFGIDVHCQADKVSKILAGQGVTAQLSVASMTELPFEDGYFDCLVAVSSLEFVGDITLACTEIARVLSSRGVFIVVTPAKSAIVDFGLKLLTGEDANRDFGARREKILPELERVFKPVLVVQKPRTINRLVNLYTGLKLEKR